MRRVNVNLAVLKGRRDGTGRKVGVCSVGMNR